MLNIIKLDLFRAKKDRALLIGAIMCFVFVALSFILSAVIGDMSIVTEDPSIYTGYINSLYATSNAGLVILLILILYSTKDYQFGTIRNQIVSGQSKTKIYIGHFISNVIIGSILLLAQAILTLISQLIINRGYGIPFDMNEFLKLVSVTLLALLSFTGFVAMQQLISTFIKSAGLSVLALMGITLFGSIALQILTNDFFPNFINSFVSWTGCMTNSDLLSVLNISGLLATKVIVSSIFSIVLFGGLGLLVFNKKDMK